jgi:hypothetical protein
MKPTPHGTTNGYKNYGCRCDKCRAANTRFQRKWMAAHPDAVERKRINARIKRRGVTDLDPNELLVKPAVHGELSGIRKHKRDKTPLCRLCGVLNTKIRKEREAARRARLTPHGTESALRRHYRLGQKPCAKCRKVYKIRKSDAPNS